MGVSLSVPYMTGLSDDSLSPGTLAVCELVGLEENFIFEAAVKCTENCFHVSCKAPQNLPGQAACFEPCCWNPEW